MDIPSFLPINPDLTKSGTDQASPGDAVQSIHADRENQEYRQQDQDSELALAVKAQPLQLVLRAIIEKIHELFEAQPPVIHSFSTLDLSPATTAQQIIRYLSSAYAEFRQRFSDTNETEIMQRFSILAEQTIHQGLTEARTILTNLKLYDATLAGELEDIKELVDLGLEYIQTQAS